ncbi:protein JINGUBANG-like [Phragmites australis]|uniref:protein JINGUBANG-like n=1 Tax=Phragmites australis TaxID=29695 RepID=UPI002D77B2AD|nr:protein JINGUBANG-like [Phragmites australis]
MGNHKKLIRFLPADPAAAAAALSSPRSLSSNSSVSDDDGYSSSSFPASTASSPSRYSLSTPPKSPWVHLPGLGADNGDAAETTTGLIASLATEDGKVYSLAAAGDVLYTGTDSANVRVWRDRRELTGFRTGSGLVKAIVVAGDGRIFTGHQDGKIRVWRADADDPAVHRRVGSLPALGDFLMGSVNPSCYVETPRRGRSRRRGVWLRHSDAVSCLSLDEDAGLLYSGSWDRTFKVWRVSDSRCLESVPAHDDAVNTIAAAGFDGLVFTGSADGTVKVWRLEAADPKGDRTRNVLQRVLGKGESAVTAIAVSPQARVVYVGSSDGLVTYWRWGLDGEARYDGVLVGHKMAVMCLAVSGSVIVSGSADRTLCVWRRDDGAEHIRLAVLVGHTGPVKCVALADEDENDADAERRFVVYSGSLDGSVKVWRLSEEHALEPAPAAESLQYH